MKLYQWTHEGVHPERIQIALLLNLAGFGEYALEALSASLTNTRFSSNSSERAEALLLLGEDTAELNRPHRGAREDNDVLDGALAVARTVEPQSRRNALLQRVADAFVRSGDTNKAASIYVESGGGPLVLYQETGLIGKYRQLTKEGKSLNALSVKLSSQFYKETVEAQDWSEALKWIESLDTAPQELQELESLKRGGDSFLKDDHLRLLTEIAERYQQAVERRAERMSFLIQKLVAAGKKDQARRLLPQARTYAKRVPDDRSKVTMLESVFEAAIEAGDVEAAFGISTEILLHSEGSGQTFFGAHSDCGKANSRPDPHRTHHLRQQACRHRVG